MSQQEDFIDPDSIIQNEVAEQYFDAAQAREQARLDLNFLAALAIPDIFRFAFAPLFAVLWHMLAEAVSKVKKFERFAIGLPRGHGKSTLIKLFVLYVILFTKRKFILVVAARDDLANNIIADVMDMLSSYNIVKLFGDWQSTAESKRADLKKFTFRNRPIILAGLGFNSSVRGLNLKNVRPDFMIFDDAQTRECALNPTLAKEFVDRFYGTFMKLKAPEGCLYVYIGNLYKNMTYTKPGSDRKFWCCLLRHFKDDPNWTSFITGALLIDGQALWPDLYTREELLEELKVDAAAGQEDTWFAEVQNDPEAETACRFDYGRIAIYDPDALLPPEGAFLIIDPSLGQANSDMQAVGHFDIYDGKPYFARLMPMQTNPKQLIQDCLDYCIDNRIPLICIESVAYQKSLVFWFSFFAERLALSGINIIPISPKGKQKNARIMAMLRNFLPGNMPISKQAYPFALSQIQAFDPSTDKNTDDVLDVMAYSEDVMFEHAHLALKPMEMEILVPQDPVAEFHENNLLGMNYG